MDNNVAKAMAIANQTAGTAANVQIAPGATISPTSSKPQSRNGMGYEDLDTRIGQLRSLIGSQKVYAPETILRSQTMAAGAVLDFVLDVLDMDPMQATPYFLRGCRTESKLDIPVIFDPSVFLKNSYCSQYIERQSFTLQNFAAAGQVAEVVYAAPNAPIFTLGVFFRLKVVNRLSQASVTISHSVNGAYNATIYNQTIYLVDNVCCVFVPFLAPAVIADTTFDGVNNTLIPSFTVGSNYVIGARNPGGWSTGATGFSPNLTATNGIVSISNLSNVVVEATLVNNFGNPALSLTRAICENAEAAFFDTINAELI